MSIWQHIGRRLATSSLYLRIIVYVWAVNQNSHSTISTTRFLKRERNIVFTEIQYLVFRPFLRCVYAEIWHFSFQSKIWEHFLSLRRRFHVRSKNSYDVTDNLLSDVWPCFHCAYTQKRQLYELPVKIITSRFD